MIALVRRAWSAWDRFWFGFDHPLGLALTRIQLGLVLVWIYSARQFGSLQWLTGDGMVPRSNALEIMPDSIRPPFGWFLWPDSAAAAVHGLFVVLCVMILLGLGTRWVAWLAWILHMGFIQRNYSILFGADVISALFLLYLAFTRCDERLSLTARWRGRPASPRAPPGPVSSLFARMLQVQLAVIYLYTGFEKLKGASWWDGTALWTVLGNPQMVKHDLSWVRHFPLAIATITFLTVIFEIYWPAAMLSSPRLRRLWLGAGVLFHSGIGLLMGLWTFSLTMLAPYWLFLKPDECDRIFVSIRDFFARSIPLSRRLR